MQVSIRLHNVQPLHFLFRDILHKLELHHSFSGTNTMKCFADLDVNVSNNIECIDFWPLIQVMSVGEFSVIGSSYPHFVSVSFKRSE